MTVRVLDAELRNRGLSVRQAAIEIGISRTTLGKAIDGGDLHPAIAKQIADWVGKKVTDIWPIEERDAA